MLPTLNVFQNPEYCYVTLIFAYYLYNAYTMAQKEPGHWIWPLLLKTKKHVSQSSLALCLRREIAMTALILLRYLLFYFTYVFISILYFYCYIFIFIII